MTTITNLADVREGDVVTFDVMDSGVRRGPYTGPAYRHRGLLAVAGIDLSDGITTAARFVSAERPAPKMPTEPPGYIFITKARGETLDKPVFAHLDEGGDWVTTRRINDFYWHRSEHIEEWTPARVEEVHDTYGAVR